MRTRKYRNTNVGLVVVLALIMATLQWGAPAPPAEAATPVGPFAIDMTNRENVRQAYFRIHQASLGVPMNWTGNVAACNPGTVSGDFLQAVLTRTNYFRAMAGVASDVIFTAENNAKAQAAALIMSTQRELSHNPPNTWRCWTQSGRDGAAESNLSLGTTGPAAIDGLMYDGSQLGHRRQMLHPQQLEMGSGSIPASAGTASEAQHVLGRRSVTPRPIRDGFVAWPPKGFVPYQVVYPLWHLSLPGGDFSAATVTMSRNGVAIPATITTRENSGGPGIVWSTEVRQSTQWPRPADDDTISVTVGNVLVNGVPQTFQYNVTVFDPGLADPARTPLTVTGPDAPPVGVAANYAANAIPNATGYQWRTTKLTPLVFTDGGEGGLANFEALVDMYATPSTLAAATGASSFRLTTGQAPRRVAGSSRQTLTLRRAIVPTAGTVLSFKSRASRLANVTAVAEVSVDGGVTWTPVFTETATQEATFSDRAVPLAAFANRQVQLRFRTENAGTGATSCCFSEGWYIDDITVTNAFEGTPMLFDVRPDPMFSVTPTDGTVFDIDVRPQFFGSGFGDWSPAKRVSPLAPAAAPAITAQPVAATVDVGGTATFRVTATGTAPLAFVWSRNGVALTDGAGIAGSQTATLSLTNVALAQAGNYSVQVSNAAGMVTSGTALLTVNQPPPTTQPPQPPPMSLASVLNNAGITWTTSGNANWSGQNLITRDGNAAQSGAITHGQSSTLQADIVQGPATLSFWWKVESEATFDFLTVELDGVQPFPGISGNIDWQEKTITVPAGVHTIRWLYTKDASVSRLQDAGWVDQVTTTAPAA